MEVLLLLLFVLVLVVLWIAVSARRQCAIHAVQLRRFSEHFRRIERDLERLKDTISPVPSQSSGANPVSEPFAKEPESPACQPARVDTVVAATPPVLPVLPPPLPIPPLAPPSVSHSSETNSTTTGPVASDAWDWEQFFGARLLSWVGGLVLFLAVAFFVKLSFERGWVSPAMRVGSGAILGVGLILGGLRLRGGRSRTTGLTLVGTGLLVLYGVTFASHSLYRFAVFTLPVTFGLMAGVTVMALVLSVSLEALSVAVLGIAAGFLTPVLLSSGANNPLGLFGYVGLLDLGLMAVLWRTRWNVLAVLGAVGTGLMQYGWFFKFGSPEQYGTILCVFVGFGVAFALALGLARRMDRASRELELAASAMVVGIFGIGFSLLMQRTMMQDTGAFFLVVGCADLLALTVSWMAIELRRLESLASGLVFLILALWTSVWLDADTTRWALWMIVGFGLVHAGFGVLNNSKERSRGMGIQAHLFPALCVLVLFVPLVRELAMPWGFWPAVLVLDLVAIAVALVSGAILGVILVLFLSLGVAGVWVHGDVGTVGDLAESLVVIGGYAVLFFGAGCVLTQAKPIPSGDARPDIRARIPAMAALFPFLLLNMVTLKVPPADPAPILGVALFLSLLSLGWAWWRSEGSVAMLTLICVFLTQGAWLLRLGTPAHWGWVLGWNLLFYVLFTAFSFLWQGRFMASRWAWVSSALAGPLQFLLIHGLIRKVWPDARLMGLIPLGFAIPSALLAWRLWRSLPGDTPIRLQGTAWFGAVTLFFITVALPIQFDRQVLTVALGLEGMALIALHRRLPHPGLRTAGVAMLVAGFVRLTLNPALLDYGRSGVVVWNWYLYTYGIVTACLFAAARMLGPSEAKIWGIPMRPLLNTLGTVLAFVLVNLEIADAFASGPRLTIELTGNFARGLSYTVAWALFAFGLLAVGLRRAIAPSRYAGLVLMGVTLLKLLLLDTARLEQLYRIGAFAAVAVLSILASFLYQRFHRATEPARAENNTTE